jgi:hypothetical protein
LICHLHQPGHSHVDPGSPAAVPSILLSPNLLAFIAALNEAPTVNRGGKGLSGGAPCDTMRQCAALDAAYPPNVLSNYRFNYRKNYRKDYRYI